MARYALRDGCVFCALHFPERSYDHTTSSCNWKSIQQCKWSTTVACKQIVCWSNYQCMVKQSVQYLYQQIFHAWWKHWGGRRGKWWGERYDDDDKCGHSFGSFRYPTTAHLDLTEQANNADDKMAEVYAMVPCLQIGSAAPVNCTHHTVDSTSNVTPN